MSSSDANWRKSSYSNTGGGQCVEVATAAGMLSVRDTVQRDGITLSVSPSAWTAFLATL